MMEIRSGLEKTEEGRQRSAAPAPEFAGRLLPLLLVAAMFALLAFQLDVKSLSGDEFGNVKIERGSLAWILDAMTTAWSQHPPGSHLVMHVWIGLLGESDFAVRYPAVCWTVLSLALFYRLARRWFGLRVALIAGLLFSLAPDMILYGRMEKYYSLVVALVLLSVLIFDRNLSQPKVSGFVLQGALTLTLLYTDYFASLFVIATQNVIALLQWRRSPRTLAAWLAPQLLAVCLFVPFAGVALRQASSAHAGPEADLGAGALATVAKLGYFLFSYSVGETVFPWMLSAIVGLFIFSGCAFLGLWRCFTSRSSSWRRPCVSAVTYCGVTIVGSVLLTSTVLKTVPMITVPNHVLFALPFFLLIVATGIEGTGRLRPVWVGLAVAAVTPSLVNYYSGHQFHNPVFVTPSREVLSYIVERSAPGDLMIAHPASGVLYYYEKRGLTHPLPVTTVDEVERYVSSGEASRVWLVTVGLDRMRRRNPDPRAKWVEGNMNLVDTHGFAEQDGVYRQVKARLTGRPAYRYRVVVQLFSAAVEHRLDLK